MSFQVQGGFLVVRPNMDTFNEFRDIIRKGMYLRYIMHFKNNRINSQFYVKKKSKSI
jgi:hypothetical protein